MNELSKQRRMMLLNDLIVFVENKLIEAVIALIAAVILHFVIGDFIPSILSTELSAASGAIKFSLLLDSEKLGRIFSIRNCFVVLFGVRFVIDFLMNGFRNSFKGVEK